MDAKMGHVGKKTQRKIKETSTYSSPRPDYEAHDVFDSAGPRQQIESAAIFSVDSARTLIKAEKSKHRDL
jgi:hypothetical protein